MLQPCASGGVESAARRFPQGGVHRRGWHHRWERWRVQTRHRFVLQRHLGLRAADCESGQHRRGALPVQPSRELGQPQRQRGMDRARGGTGGPSGWHGDGPRRHRFHPHRATGSLGRPGPLFHSGHGCASQGGATGRSFAGKCLEAIGTAPKYDILTEPRAKAFRYKEQIVIQKEFRNQKLVGEDIAEMEYQPHKCGRKYRLVIVRKNISVQQGERALLDEIRYFFYITNRKDKAHKIVGLANGRCDQENVIEQLKNGVNAMRMPVNDLLSNWAYMVMAGLAWNLKSWYGLLVPARERGLELVRMEFRRFLNAILLIPCQVVRTGRRLIYRVLSYNRWLKDFFSTWERLQRLVFVQ